MFRPAFVIIAIASLGGLAAAGGVMALDQSFASRAAVVPVAADGHFWVMASAQGGSARLLVDTGATRVSLTMADAANLGVDLTEVRFDQMVHTPAGPMPVATTRLDQLSVGSTQIHDVEAIIFQEGLGASLLGMSYLGRLARFEASPQTLRLSN